MLAEVHMYTSLGVRKSETADEKEKHFGGINNNIGSTVSLPKVLFLSSVGNENTIEWCRIPSIK